MGSSFIHLIRNEINKVEKQPHIILGQTSLTQTLSVLFLVFRAFLLLDMVKE